jgi:hypothetical protein
MSISQRKKFELDAFLIGDRRYRINHRLRGFLSQQVRTGILSLARMSGSACRRRHRKSLRGRFRRQGGSLLQIRPAAICKNPAFSPALGRPLVDGEMAPHLKHLLNFAV